MPLKQKKNPSFHFFYFYYYLKKHFESAIFIFAENGIRLFSVLEKGDASIKSSFFFVLLQPKNKKDNKTSSLEIKMKNKSTLFTYLVDYLFFFF